jgi:hypothetical protein
VFSSSVSTASAIVSSTLSMVAAVTSFTTSPSISSKTPNLDGVLDEIHHSVVSSPLSQAEHTIPYMDSRDANTDPTSSDPIHVEL